MKVRLARAVAALGWVVAAACVSASRDAVAAEESAAGGAPVTTGTEQPDSSIELRLYGGGAALGFTQRQDTDPHQDIDVGNVAAVTFGVGLQWGWFADHHVQLGFTHSLTRYQWFAETSVASGKIYDEGYWTDQSGYTVFSPLGVYAEVFPSSEAGLFVALSGSIGFAASEGPGGTMLTAGYALEVGHELSGSIKSGPGLFLRFAGWAGGENPLHTDFPAGVGSLELTLGGRWVLGDAD